MIEDVLENVSDEFINAGVDDTVISDLRTVILLHCHCIVIYTTIHHHVALVPKTS